METLGYICTCYWEKPGIEAMIGLVQGLYVARDLLRRFVDTEHYILSVNLSHMEHPKGHHQVVANWLHGFMNHQLTVCLSQLLHRILQYPYNSCTRTHNQMPSLYGRFCNQELNLQYTD